jgi:serine/threonine-protein kinase
VHRSVWDDKEYEGQALSDDARPVHRYFGGSFVIFQKTSIYNHQPDTYDGRHNTMTSDAFREHVGAMAGAYLEWRNSHPNDPKPRHLGRRLAIAVR